MKIEKTNFKKTKKGEIMRRRENRCRKEGRGTWRREEEKKEGGEEGKEE